MVGLMNAVAARQRLDTPWPRDVQTLLHNVGLRSTPQRIALARLLRRTAKQRITAEILFAEAQEASCPVSRATVCNTLRQFERAGLLKQIAVHQSKKAWFVIANVDAGRQSRGRVTMRSAVRRN
jgi:Fe2+ or Zn2+ uptake regulation protein